MHLIVDPGHGGSNTGYANDHYREKDYTLKLALRLGLWLDATRICTFDFTRVTDDYVSFKERNRIARNGDLVLSIHTNAFVESSAHGSKIFYWPSNATAKHLAEIAGDALPMPLRRGHGMSQALPADKARYPRANGLLSAYDPTVILFESFFATNPDDLAYGLTEDGQNALCATLMVMLCEAAQIFRKALPVDPEAGADTPVV